MKSILDGLVADGSLTKELMLTGFNEFVLTSLNYDSSANSFFVDLLNENYDVARDIMTAEDGGTLRIHLPESLKGKLLSVKFYDPDKNGAAQTVTFMKVDDSTIEASIPGFRVYGSLVIKKG